MRKIKENLQNTSLPARAKPNSDEIFTLLMKPMILRGISAFFFTAVILLKLAS
jgi:hypothetical protein